mgnify:CR=1 FL=1
MVTADEAAAITGTGPRVIFRSIEAGPSSCFGISGRFADLLGFAHNDRTVGMAARSCHEHRTV